MDMPEVLQHMIQEFARPVTRGDWRTCKWEEAYGVQLLCRDEPHNVADQIGPEYWDIIVSQSLYDLITRYPAGPASEEGQTTIRLKRVWRA
jgi:hypothetical protein